MSETKHLRVRKLTPWEQVFCFAFETAMGYLPGVASVLLFNQEAEGENSLKRTALRTWVESKNLDPRLATSRCRRWLIRGHRIFQEADERGVKVHANPELYQRFEDWKKDNPFGPVRKFQKLAKTAGVLLIVGMISTHIGVHLSSALLMGTGIALAVVALTATIAGYQAAGK